MTDEDKGIGVEGTTDRYGKASFQLSDKTQRVDAIYVDPLHSGWPMHLAEVHVVPGGVEIAVAPIDLAVADPRGTVYVKPIAGSGKTVRVAVVDTGVGPHSALKIKRGLNTTAAESGRRFRDEDGHGSHVAGVIASAAAGWRRGEASAVELHAYRIFESGDPYASSFAIAAAIKDAAIQGCDLVNLRSATARRMTGSATRSSSRRRGAASASRPPATTARGRWTTRRATRRRWPSRRSASSAVGTQAPTWTGH